MSLPFLQTIGLSTTEANLYELLLRFGEVPVGELIKESKLKRPTVYKALYALEKKKLVTKRDVAKKIHFRPEPPTELLALADKQTKELERARGDLRAILPQLNSSYILAVERPVVTTFEGVEGLKEIYEDTLKEGKPIYAVLQTAEVEPALRKWLDGTYVKKRIKAKIWAKVIVAGGKGAKEYANRDEKACRESILVSKEQFPFAHEVDIYGDKVAFINYRQGEALIGLIINHSKIAQTMKAWFDLAWEGTKYLEQKN